MNSHTQEFSLTGSAGPLECRLDKPEHSPRGIALIAHPHPLYGGTMDNKVVQTLARAFIAVGYVCVRMNFRGVGQSGGIHDAGEGETDDMARMVLVGCAAGKWAMPTVPSDTLLIHGEQDDTIPLSDVLDWARPQDLPVIVIPGADHFFHRKLHHIKQLVIDYWRHAP